MRKFLFLLFVLFGIMSCHQRATSNNVYQKLIESIKSNNTDSFDELIMLIPNIDSLILYDDSNSYSLLGYACMSGNYDLSARLIDMNADINLVHSDGMYEYDALYIAVNNQDKRIIKLLLEKGIPVNTIYNENGTTPLTAACTVNNYDIVKMLIQKGAKVDGAGDCGGDYIQYPLLIAIENKNAEIIRILVDNQANTNITDREGNNVLNLAKQTGNPEIEKIFQ